MAKRKLSVFIDESGDLGEYNEVTEFYVIFLSSMIKATTSVIKLKNSLIQ